MENEETARRTARSKAGFDNEAPLEVVSAGATEAVTQPAGYVAQKAISGMRFLTSEFQDGSCPTGWCKSRRSKVGSGSDQAATAGRLTMGLWLTEPRVSSVM